MPLKIHVIHLHSDWWIIISVAYNGPRGVLKKMQICYNAFDRIYYILSAKISFYAQVTTLNIYGYKVLQT